MSAQVPEQIRLHEAGGHVEVEGLSLEEVRSAIALSRSVGVERLRARGNLSAIVHRAMLDAHVPLISAATQRQVQRSAALREELLVAQGYESHVSLAEKRQQGASSVRTWVSRLRERGSLFTVKVNGQTLIPAVQLTPDGRLDEDVASLVRPLVTAGLEGWSVWAWLVNPTGRLSGEVPSEVAGTHPQRALKAAERYAAEIRQSTTTA